MKSLIVFFFPSPGTDCATGGRPPSPDLVSDEIHDGSRGSLADMARVVLSEWSGSQLECKAFRKNRINMISWTSSPSKWLRSFRWYRQLATMWHSCHADLLRHARPSRHILRDQSQIWTSLRYQSVGSKIWWPFPLARFSQRWSSWHILFPSRVPAGSTCRSCRLLVHNHSVQFEQ